MAVAAIGAAIDRYGLQEDDRAGKQGHPENLGSDGI
jgi:hypothetical protein